MQEELNYNLRYLVMPDFIYEDSRLSGISMKLYCFIHTFKGKAFFFGNEHLAKMFNCSDSSITKAIGQLQELGYIKTTYKIKSEGGKVRFVEDLKSEARTRKNYSSEPEDTLVPNQKDLRYNGNNTNGNNINNTNNSEAIIINDDGSSTISLKGKDFNDLLALFEPVNPSFERLYPNKSQRSALQRMINKHGTDKIRWVLMQLPHLANDPYAPVITTPYQLEAKLGQLLIYLGRQKDKGGGIVDARNI